VQLPYYQAGDGLLCGRRPLHDEHPVRVEGDQRSPWLIMVEDSYKNMNSD